jgi:capsular exopolysaccharide synthesis family protein
MSRIDEALARARGDNAIPVPPVMPVEEGHGTFPSEAEPEPKPEAKAGSAESRPVRAAKDELVDEAAPTPEAKAGERVIDVDEDVHETVRAQTLSVNSGDATSTEQYRRLAGRLYLAQAEHGTRIVMVTSALPGEGKTLTSTNVALTLAESYKRQVLLIDADLRRPWIHEMFQVPNLSGLNDGLRSEEDHKIPLLRLTDHLSILTAGRPDRDPMSVLSSDRMKRVLQEASARFDWVVIDTPPVALLTDAHLLASLVDAVLLVIQSGKTPLSAINKAVEAVGRERVLGVVLSRADSASVYRAYDYYGAYGGQQAAAMEKSK